MAKRKVVNDEDSEESAFEVKEEDGLEDGPLPRLKKAKPTKSKVTVKNESSSEQDGIPLANKPKISKKGKTNQDPSPSEGTDDGGGAEITVLVSSEGEKYIDLGKKKRATIRSFKGRPLVDVREFYGNDGEEKPGKKGISLTIEQWNELKKSVSIIDNLIKKLP